MLARPQFLACYESGKKFFSRNFILFALENDEPEAPWRSGFAVSKKLGSATRRNRIKRLLREFFRTHKEAITKPFDFVVVPKRHVNAKKLTLEQVEDELQYLISKAQKNKGVAAGNRSRTKS